MQSKSQFDPGNCTSPTLELRKDGAPIIDGRKLSNGLSIPRCVSRFKELDSMLEDNTLPKRDFQLKYSKEKLETLSDSRRLRKKQAEEFDKNKDLDMGDWQCSYCSYKDYCWKDEQDGKSA